MWLEGIRAPVEHLAFKVLFRLRREVRQAGIARKHPHNVFNALLDILRVGGFEERFGDPVLAHRRATSRGAFRSDRVEDEVVPFLRLLKALVLAQRVGD